MKASSLDSTDKVVAQESLLSKAPIRAYAALATGRPPQPWTFAPGPLAADEVELAVTHCPVLSRRRALDR